MTTLTFKVPEMSCSHCEAAIHKALDALPGVSTVEVDLEAKLVRVTGEAPEAKALLAGIDGAGFDATLLA